ncbi:MAG: hypothetical protein FWE19_05870 [Oscillospiraceae bacterium]|nr:hypothetical protein [Oscillospiraceae bacterium]
MTYNKRFTLATIFVVTLLFASCAGQQESPPEQLPVEQAVSPEPNSSERNEMATPPPEYEYEAVWEEQTPAITTEVAQAYYAFFSSLEIIEYVGIHGPGQMWGHRVGDEVRLTKVVVLSQIEELGNPILVLYEFALENDGLTVNEFMLASAYLVRDGELDSVLNEEEFGTIFNVNPIIDGWPTHARDPNGVIQEVEINGERVFSIDLLLGSQAEMDTLLGMLRERM